MHRVLLAALFVAGCNGDHVAPATPDMALVPAFAAHDQVDLLFVIDNSDDAPIQQEMQGRFPELIKGLDQAAAAGHPASDHIGVVATDLATGTFAACGGTPSGGTLYPGIPSHSSFSPPAD